jgi:hypothetical protein
MSSLPLLFSFFFFFLVELGFELSAWCLQSKAQPSPKKLNKGQNLELGLVGNIKMGKKEKKKNQSWVPMANIYNPCYLGD